MPDFRGIPINYTGLSYSLSGYFILEQAEPNMTLGSRYDLIGLIIDNAPVSGSPKPYALTVDDNDHFKLVDLAKVKRATA